jgi:predicted membrane protein
MRALKEMESVHERRTTAKTARKRQENRVSDEKNFDGKKFSDDLRDQIHRDIHEKVKGRRDPIVVGIHLGAGKCRSFRGGIIWGAIILLVGVAFLLDNLGIFPVERVFRLWPLILMGAGAANLSRREHRVWGVVLFIIGSVFLLDSLGIAHFHWSQLWPLALIVAGLLVMWNSLEARRANTTVSGGRNTLNELAFFGGIERRITTQNFEGGQAIAIFGGIEIDLRQASMETDEAVLDVNSIFGGCEIRVPETWTIITQGQGIFGGYTDNTRQTGVEDLSNPKKKTLFIRGAAVFGGVEIKN